MPVLTREAVAACLSGAGFSPVLLTACGSPLADGFCTYLAPAADGERVGVSWHSEQPAGAYVHTPEPVLDECAAELRLAGYHTEFTADHPKGYLVVWVDGGS